MVSLKARDSSIFGKMKQFFDNLAQKIRKAYEGVRPDSAEGRAVLEMRDSVERIQGLFAEALVDASENYRGTNDTKNTAQEGGEVRFSIRDGKLTSESTEKERYDLLKNSTVKVAKINKSAIQNVNLEDYNTRKKSAVVPGFRALARQLGILNVNLQNSEIDFPFQFSRKNLEKSLHHQLEYGGTYQDYVKAMSCFNELVENAVPIEVHSEKKKGTIRENPDLKQTYVLVSAFQDENTVIPVEMEVKTFWSANSQLYMTVALTKIDSEVLEKAPATSSGDTLSLFPESTYSLQSIFKNVNPKDSRFLKYVPDGFLNEAQKQAKQEALQRQSEEYAGYGTLKNSDRNYTYESLTSKPDMAVTKVGGNVPKNRADVVYQAKQNAAKIGKFNPKDGSVKVHVKDIDSDVVIGRDGLKHSIDRRFDVNAPVILKAGEILSNSIRINEMTPKKVDAKESYILIGAAKNETGELYVVRSVVNRFQNKLVSMDVLYAINAKKEPAALLPLSTGKPALGTGSTISISKLLDYVNDYFPDILPEDVLKHYGYDERPQGELGESALYSDRDPEAVKVNQVLQKENAKLKEDVSYLKELLKLQRQVTGGTKFTKSSVDAAASVLMKSESAKGNKAELAGILNGFYGYIAKSEDLSWDGIQERAKPAVQWLQEHADWRPAQDYAYDAELAAQDLTRQVYESYWNVSTLYTVADVKHME